MLGKALTAPTASSMLVTRKPETPGSISCVPREHDLLAVDQRLDLQPEVLVVRDDSRDDQSTLGRLGDEDRVARPLVGMDPSEEQQIVFGRLDVREVALLDAMMDGRQVAQGWVPLGIADGDVMRGAVVFLVHGKNLLVLLQEWLIRDSGGWVGG